ncbi:MAG TPA: hypothetical protein VF540_09340 [Segetibacter sp.]|jgi:hypothetical protein
MNNKKKILTKVLTIITLPLLVSLLANCNKQLTSSADSKELIVPERREMLLEVYTKTEGMVDPSGTLLEFRLYSTGEAEAEYFLPSSPQARTSNSTVRKNIILKKDVFDQLNGLIKSPDFINAKSYNSSSIPVSDASTTTTISFKSVTGEKRILLKESDTTLHLENKDNVYPKSLIELLKLIEKLRNENGQNNLEHFRKAD